MFMKRLLLIISSILTLTACSNEGFPVHKENKAIAFSNVATRAEVTEASAITEFKVFGEMNLGDDGTDEASQWVTLFDEGELVSREGSSDNWTYDNKRYWVDNRTFRFFAFYPSSTNVRRIAMPNGWVYSSTIEVPYAANTDFMTAMPDATYVTPGVTPGTVDLSFKHRFARVRFNIYKNAVMNTDDSFVVTDIGISGISRTANFTAYFASGQPYEFTLSPNAANGTVLRRNLAYDIAVGEVNEGVLTGGTLLLGDNDGLLLIPQDISNGQASLNLSFTYKQKEGTEVEYQTISKPLPGGYAWEAGKTYVYTLELKDDKNIYISTPTVEGWGTTQPGGFIIIN